MWKYSLEILNDHPYLWLLTKVVFKKKAIFELILAIQVLVLGASLSSRKWREAMIETFALLFPWNAMQCNSLHGKTVAKCLREPVKNSNRLVLIELISLLISY